MTKIDLYQIYGVNFTQWVSLKLGTNIKEICTNVISMNEYHKTYEDIYNPSANKTDLRVKMTFG
jgi:hypothetical protein